MKRIGLIVAFSALLLMMTAGGAFAWNLCYQDTAFTPQYQVNVETGIIRGQAVLEGNPGFPAPITGFISGNTAAFSIGYLGDLGLRFYVIDVFTGAGTTWGIDHVDSTYYDPPHAAQLAACGAAATDGTATGAAH